MKFELINIDPETCTIEELDNEISRLDALKEEYFNLEQSIKIFINSIYGGVGSPWFECYNVSLAEAVTLQGQDMIKFANDLLDDYFLEKWHLDKSLHDALGLTFVNKVQSKTIVIYNDTDSTYITLKPVIESCDWKGDPIDFILKLKDLRKRVFIQQGIILLTLH